MGLIQGVNHLYGRNAVTIPLGSELEQSLPDLSLTIGFGSGCRTVCRVLSNRRLSIHQILSNTSSALGEFTYQLGVWDEAVRQFQLAANLKNDYANAFYNLGHAYESKGDEASLKIPLQAYQYVATLVAQ